VERSMRVRDGTPFRKRGDEQIKKRFTMGGPPTGKQMFVKEEKTGLCKRGKDDTRWSRKGGEYYNPSTRDLRKNLSCTGVPGLGGNISQKKKRKKKRNKRAKGEVRGLRDRLL